MLDLSVIIPTHNRHSLLLELIDSFSRCENSDLKFEIIVVSNLKDSFVESITSHPMTQGLEIKTFTSGCLGVNKARNMGLQKSRGFVSFFMDDDCQIIDPRCFSKILHWHKAYPRALAIGGIYKPDPEASAIDIAYNLLARAWQSPSVYKDHESSRLVGGCVSYKTGDILKCGELFDENIHFGGTESEFHRRLNRRGFQTLFFENLYVQHKTRLNTFGLIRRAYFQAKTKSQYDIDGGYTEVDLKTYQQKRELWAFKKAGNQKNFQDILYFINLYDIVYNLTLRALNKLY